MSTREWGLGYDEGYEKGWNDAMDQKPSQQEPVAWLHRFIEGGISIGLKPADLKRHPERWEPLYTYPPQQELVCVCGAVWEGQELVETPPEPRPCPTCEALARTVMLDQTAHDTPPQRTWVGLVQGVRVDGDTVVIKVKNGNDAARELCGALIEEINK